MFFDYGAPPTPTVLENNTISVTVTPSTAVGKLADVEYGIPQDVGSIPLVSRVMTTAAGTGVNLEPVYLIREPGKLFVAGTIAIDAEPQQIVASVHYPGIRMANAFAAHLRDAGVTVTSTSASVFPLCLVGSSKLIGTITSPNLAPIMNNTLKISDNIQAELWMRLLAQNSVPTNQSNYELGIDRVRQVLAAQGVDTSAFIQTDGCGLGRSNQVQPNACVDVLRMMINRPIWISMLPVGGVDGTLRHRFIGTPAEGRVHAKTGSLTGVNSLSGYVFAANFSNPIVFSIIANESSDIEAHIITDGMDKIVVGLAELKKC